MELDEVFSRRKSVRSYTGTPASAEELQAVLAAAQASPVARAWYDKIHLTIVSQPELLARIDAAGAAEMGMPGTHVLYGAPTLIIVSAHIATPALENPMHSSAAIIVHSMALKATELHLGSCDIWGAIRGVVADNELIEALQLPLGFEPCCALTLGRTDEDFPHRPAAERIEVDTLA